MTTLQRDLEDAVPGETRKMAMMHAVNAALDRALEDDPKLVLLGEDIADPAGGVFKATKGLSTTHGTDRVRSTPIAEQGIVGAAVGLALAGYRPVAEVMFCDFLTIASDQLVNHAAKMRYMSGGSSRCPITIRTMVGDQRFGAQHSQSLEAWFMHTPGIKVVYPSNPVDAKGLLASCIADDDPCLFIEHISLAFGSKAEVPVDDYRTPLGKAAVVREGSDITVITYGPQVPTALAAADALADRGIDTEVIDLRTLLPLDTDRVLEAVSHTKRAAVLHEATRFLGPGAEIAATIHEELFGELAAPVLRIGGAFAPRPYAPSLSLNASADQVAEQLAGLAGR